MEKGVRRWMVNISRWNPSLDQFDSLVSLLPEHERPDITRFIKFEDKKHALVSRLLQYSVVHEVLGIPFEKITINRTIEGKPYLEKSGENMMFPNFNFNVSHHGDYVGIASEPMCLVGLDIISIDILSQETVFDFIKNFKSYFTAFEWKNIIDAGNSNDILAEFCRYWSLKEAYVKALSTGLGYGLHRLEFHHMNWTGITIHVDGIESGDWQFQLFELVGRHWAAVARGHPRVNAGSFRAPAEVETGSEDIWNGLQCEETPFIFRTVEEIAEILL